MSDVPDSSIKFLLGQLVAQGARAEKDRVELREEMRARHEENSTRLDALGIRVANIETKQSEQAGAKAAVKYLLGLLLTVLSAGGVWLKWGR